MWNLLKEIQTPLILDPCWKVAAEIECFQLSSVPDTAFPTSWISAFVAGVWTEADTKVAYWK